MIRKSLIALLMTLTLGAVVPQLASAVPYTPGVGAGQTAYLTAESTTNHVPTIAGGSIACTTVRMSGTTVGTSSTEFTLSPTYSSCTALGFPPDVKMNGCTHTFTEPTNIGGGSFTLSPPHIVCPTGQQIEVTPTSFGVSACTLKIPPQTPTGGHLILKNAGGAGSAMDVTFEYTEEGIHYTGTGGPCGNAETHTDGKTTGSYTLKAFSNAAHTTQVSLTVE